VDAKKARLLLFVVILVGVLLDFASFWTAANSIDPIGWAIRRVLITPLGLTLLAWNLLAWGARRLIVGKPSKEMLRASRSATALGFLRFASTVAMLGIIACLLVSLVLGSDLRTSFFKAFVLIAFFSVSVSVVGGAVLNSMLIAKHYRREPVPGGGKIA
jgi:hypothetical protein